MQFLGTEETMPPTNMVKENKSWSERDPLSVRWVLVGALWTVGALLVVARIDHSLPAPRPPPPATPPTEFSGVLAHEHLVNLTSIGPRVAGSYENEVLAVASTVRAVKHIAAHASIHNHVELDLHRASGAFSLTFFDGMNNFYRDVQSVVVRVRGAGGGARGKRSALLLNCHLDTVPGSPGASDDGAGCAVLLEVLRALAATPHPLKHDAIFLFNGAEENIMQASHAFITSHKWAKSVRAFINIEACGAGGREVLFQAGPHDPWIMEVYAGVVPHPFASSLAQEMFESGLVPGDTDFRVFRDFGKLSGVDLAWSSNGYVYHTHLDTAARVPPAALQRTGDNVLALAHGLLASESLESEVELSSQQPVFFDVLGVFVVVSRAPLAAALAAATLALQVLVAVHDTRQAAAELYVSQGAWWRAVGGACVAVGAAHAVGLGAAGAVGGAMHAVAPLAFYSRPWLLGPLYALPAVAAAWFVLLRLMRGARVGAVTVRGWWAARLVGGAVGAGWAALLGACVVRGVRSGFVPLQWALLLGGAARAAQLGGADGAGRMWWWAAGAVLPLMQTWYLALGCLQMFVPIMARAGTTPLPPDVILGVVTAALSLAAASWLLPLVAAAAARPVRRLLLATLGLCALGAAAAALLPPYTHDMPQRFMIFHTRRTVHADNETRHTDQYWAPHFDPNTPRTLRTHTRLADTSWYTDSCVDSVWPYCGAPYFLPVVDLIHMGYWASAPAPPAVALNVSATTEPLPGGGGGGGGGQALHVDIDGPTHVVLIVSPVPGVRATWCSILDGPPLPAARWGPRDTYFIALHAARAQAAGARWRVTLHLERDPLAPTTRTTPTTRATPTTPPRWATLSVAGHGLADKNAEVHQKLLDSFPNWTATVGWGVHLHLLNV